MGDNGAKRDLLLKELDAFFKNAKENNIVACVFSYMKKDGNAIKLFRTGQPAIQLLLNEMLKHNLMSNFIIKKEVE